MYRDCLTISYKDRDVTYNFSVSGKTYICTRNVPKVYRRPGKHLQNQVFWRGQLAWELYKGKLIDEVESIYKTSSFTREPCMRFIFLSSFLCWRFDRFWKLVLYFISFGRLAVNNFAFPTLCTRKRLSVPLIDESLIAFFKLTIKGKEEMKEKYRRKTAVLLPHIFTRNSIGIHSRRRHLPKR